MQAVGYFFNAFHIDIKEEAKEENLVKKKQEEKLDMKYLKS